MQHLWIQAVFLDFFIQQCVVDTRKPDGFAKTFFQDPSLLAFLKRLQENAQQNNLSKVFLRFLSIKWLNTATFPISGAEQGFPLVKNSGINCDAPSELSCSETSATCWTIYSTRHGMGAVRSVHHLLFLSFRMRYAIVDR